MFKSLCDQKKVSRYSNGVYYLPVKSQLEGGSSLPVEVVARYKYISRNGRIMGYYSGFTFANQLGITKQVPYTTEIVTNNSGGKFREVNIKGQKLVLRKPRVTVNETNYKVLQLLDLLKDLDMHVDEIDTESITKMAKYIVDSKIKRESIDKYLALYPDKIFRIIYETRLYDVIAQ